MRRAWAFLFVVLLAAPHGFAASPSTESITRSSVHLWIPAVGQAQDGRLFGVASELEVVQQRPGTGEIFLSTEPLTQIDMQGSARLAVQTAAAITGRRADDADYFFTVRTSSITVGGPSAGGAMAVAAVALLQGWSIREDVVMTGMINPDGSIGPIGGVPQKLEAADSVGATRFLVPLGQAIVVDQGTTVDVRERGRERFGIEVQEVADLYDAVEPFTGFRLVRPTPTTDPLKDQAYTNITRTLAANLTEEASRRATEAARRHAAVSAEMGAQDRSLTAAQISTSQDRARSARQAQNESRFYLASSRAFQGMVAASYAEAIIGFYEQSAADAAAYASSYVAETRRRIDAVGAEINLTFPYPASRLDAQAAAEQRYLDALAGNAQAATSLSQGARGAALQSSSFARQRAESARWWFAIGDLVSGTTFTPLVQRAAVDTLIANYAETAQLQLEYANLIVGDATALQGATQALQDAQRAHESGRLAASLFEMIEALARTSTALVALAGVEPLRQRLPDVADGAAYQIELAQAQGTPPVYAISLLELANSTAAEDPIEAYTSYSLARLAARTSLQAANIAAPAPRVERTGPGFRFFGESDVPPWVWAGLAVALIAGVFLLGAWAGSAGRIEPPKPEPAPSAVVLPAPTPPLVYRPRPIRARPRPSGRVRRTKRSP